MLDTGINVLKCGSLVVSNWEDTSEEVMDARPGEIICVVNWQERVHNRE